VKGLRKDKKIFKQISSKKMEDKTVDDITHEESDISNMHQKFKPFDSIYKKVHIEIENIDEYFFDMARANIIEMINMFVLKEQLETNLYFRDFLQNLVDDFEEVFERIKSSKKDNIISIS
jgi:hypothetical protein